MFWTHNKAAKWISAAILVALAGGCQSVQQVQSERLNDKPMIIDEAMQRRDWNPTYARFESGATVAGPTGFQYEASSKAPEWQQGLAETPLFVGQVLMLPYTLLVQPVTTPVTYRGIAAEPSYTGAPAMETDVDYMARSPGYR